MVIETKVNIPRTWNSTWRYLTTMDNGGLCILCIRRQCFVKYKAGLSPGKGMER